MDSYRLDSMMNVQPQKALAKNSVFLFVIFFFCELFAFSDDRGYIHKKQKHSLS